MSPTMESTSTLSHQFEERWARMRSHKRAVASLRFLVEWEDGGSRRCANGVTVDVSHSGCMAVVGADAGRSTQGEVVWRGHEAWDIGIALTEPDASFWGVKI
jgi:hypothetical protein